MDLELNNLQRLICHKTKTTKQNLKIFNKFREIELAKEKFLTLKKDKKNVKRQKE